MRNKCIELSEVILDIAAGPFGSNLKKSCFPEDGFPIIDGANLKGFKLTDNITKFVTEEKARSLHRSIAKRNDVVVTISGTLGQISYIPEDSEYEEYLCSQRQFRVTFDTTKVYVPYSVFFFHTYEGQNKILSFANQVGVPALAQPLKNFRKIKIDLPEIEEQKKIANIIELINNKIENNAAINNNLEQQAQVIYNHQTNNSPHKEPLSNFIKIKHGYAFKGEHISTDDNGVVLVTPGNFCIGGGFKENKCKFFTSDYLDDYVLKAGSLVVTMTDLSKEADTLGYSALIPYSSQRIYLHNQRIGLVEQTNTTIPLSYVYWYMRSYEYHMGIVGSASGSTVKHTSPGRILEQLIPIPNEEDLECNITVLDNINASISRNNTENIQLQMLRDTLLPKLMSGELDVSNIDI